MGNVRVRVWRSMFRVDYVSAILNRPSRKNRVHYDTEKIDKTFNEFPVFNVLSFPLIYRGLRKRFPHPGKSENSVRTRRRSRRRFTRVSFSQQQSQENATRSLLETRSNETIFLSKIDVVTQKRRTRTDLYTIL